MVVLLPPLIWATLHLLLPTMHFEVLRFRLLNNPFHDIIAQGTEPAQVTRFDYAQLTEGEKAF